MGGSDQIGWVAVFYDSDQYLVESEGRAKTVIYIHV